MFIDIAVVANLADLDSFSDAVSFTLENGEGKRFKLSYCYAEEKCSYAMVLCFAHVSGHMPAFSSGGGS